MLELLVQMAETFIGCMIGLFVYHKFFDKNDDEHNDEHS